ncbi:MAG: phosphoribosylglycinamide formyltransferase [Nitrospirales bacterium]|nr:MAG: phosphoribosylglycinamide formyltransferase [Nitrospirales bacterium]
MGSTGRKKIAIVTNSKGSLLEHALRFETCNQKIDLLITDRECGAIDVAKKYGKKCMTIIEANNNEFSRKLCSVCKENQIDFIISVFSRLFTEEILNEYENKILNLHPSLLPAFPGMGSLKKAINSDVRYIGVTAHIIDHTIDGGPIIAQAIGCCDKGNKNQTMHKMFVAQCKLLLQSVNYLSHDRIYFENGILKIKDVIYGQDFFSPILDDADAIALDIPFPGEKFSTVPH